MATEIHPTAVVDPAAQLGTDIKIGPYCIIGPDVSISDRAELKSHVNVDGKTEIGSECVIYPFASLGTKTQDLKFKGGKPCVAIGDRCNIREYVTVNAATYDGDYTRVGSDCLLMAYSHVAHDCIVGNQVVIANCGTLAGHCIIEDQVILGGLSGVHQFVRIGTMTIVGGCSKVTQDVPPYMMADGHPLRVRAINTIGLERRGVTKDHQKLIKEAFRTLYRKKLSTKHAVESIENDLQSCSEIEALLAFVRKSERGITK